MSPPSSSDLRLMRGMAASTAGHSKKPSPCSTLGLYMTTPLMAARLSSSIEAQTWKADWSHVHEQRGGRASRCFARRHDDRRRGCPAVQGAHLAAAAPSSVHQLP